MSKRILSLLMAAVLLLSLTACGGEEPAPETPTTTTTTTKPTTTTTTEPPLPQNLLTGVRDMETDNNRPIAFAVPDETNNIVQVGIEHADMYFEAETEAGIPRMLAIFSSVDRMPKHVGPVRSARPHFIKFVNALDAIYGHIGGSGAAREAIRNQKIHDIESAHEIDSILAASDNYSWNRKAFVKDKVMKVIDRCDYPVTTDTVAPYAFGEKEGDIPATALDVKISRSYNIGFTYNKKTGVYEKHRVTMRGDGLAADLHDTGTGGYVTAKNVIVMYDNWSVLDYKNGSVFHIDFELKQGTGLLAVNGKAREIAWKRTDAQLSFFEKDGKTPLTVAEGKTFICLMDKNLKAKNKIKGDETKTTAAE